MDILEAGMDRPQREPSRPRIVGLAMVALLIGGGAYWLHLPDAPATSPISDASTPTSSATTAAPAPAPSASVPSSPFHAYVVGARGLSCRQFLAAVVVLRGGEYGLHLVSDKRSASKRDVIYSARTGTARIHAQCGPTVPGGPGGPHVGDTNGDYIDQGSRNNEPDGARPSVAIFRADNANGWYEIVAGGPDGRLGDGDGATLSHLMADVANTPLINWVPPGRAGAD